MGHWHDKHFRGGHWAANHWAEDVAVAEPEVEIGSGGSGGRRGTVRQTPKEQKREPRIIRWEPEPARTISTVHDVQFRVWTAEHFARLQREDDFLIALLTAHYAVSNEPLTIKFETDDRGRKR